jgi:hypothetical protein
MASACSKSGSRAGGMSSCLLAKTLTHRRRGATKVSSSPSLTFGCLLDRKPQSKLFYTSIAADADHQSPIRRANACLYRACRDAHSGPLTFHLSPIPQPLTSHGRASGPALPGPPCIHVSASLSSSFNPGPRIVDSMKPYRYIKITSRFSVCYIRSASSWTNLLPSSR